MDRRERELERRAQSGDPEASLALARLRFRSLKYEPGEVWTIRFQPSAVGLLFHSARKGKKGKLYPRNKIPRHVIDQVEHLFGRVRHQR